MMVFENLLVLDMSQVFAGPLATRLFAEYGANVIKIERATGDLSRNLPFRVGGRSAYFVQNNRGKQGVCADLSQHRGKDFLWQLVERADVLIDGFSPGALERLGFSSEEMLRRNPRLIVCELSALGRDGDLGRRGYDGIGACYSGISYTASSGDSLPAMPNAALGDAMMAISSFAGVCTALIERTTSGLGQVVEASILAAYMQGHSGNLESFYLSDGKNDGRRIDGQASSVCPNGYFKTPDGKILYLTAYSTTDWQRICDVLGRDDWKADPDLRENETRVLRRDEITQGMNEWFEQCVERDVALAAFKAGGVAAAPVLSLDEVIHHPHLRDQEAVRFIEDPVIGSFPVPGLPFRLSRTPALKSDQLRDAPGIGSDNEEVSRSVLGLNDEEIDELKEAGVLL